MSDVVMLGVDVFATLRRWFRRVQKGLLHNLMSQLSIAGDEPREISVVRRFWRQKQPPGLGKIYPISCFEITKGPVKGHLGTPKRSD